ncbi:unnamed protein product [Arctogadus glacialis]
MNNVQSLTKHQDTMCNDRVDARCRGRCTWRQIARELKTSSSHLNNTLEVSSCCKGQIVAMAAGFWWYPLCPCVNMAAVLQELHSKGHSMLVLRSAKSWYIPEPSPYKTSLNVRVMNSTKVTKMEIMVMILLGSQELLHRHFPPGADLRSMQHSADIWLMRVDFVFEFPRPTMPNMVYIGGFQCREANPLPTELEAFMQSSGEHGVVVMSLGTLVSALPMEITEVIAEAFSRLPQKVVWRYLGHRPSNLANNTLLLEWLPQNDLLGHPKTRVFVAHGGTNGLYEAIYHGVPVLGLPLLFDQFDNLIRLKGRGAARVVDASSVNVEDFVEALRDMLENPSYRDNIQRLSRLHHDKPLSPLDTAVFWIEYVIRNKGAAHLRSASSSLPCRNARRNKVRSG